MSCASPVPGKRTIGWDILWEYVSHRLHETVVPRSARGALPSQHGATFDVSAAGTRPQSDALTSFISGCKTRRKLSPPQTTRWKQLPTPAAYEKPIRFLYNVQEVGWLAPKRLSSAEEVSVQFNGYSPVARIKDETVRN
jgi:hypothetical protein